MRKKANRRSRLIRKWDGTAVAVDQEPDLPIDHLEPKQHAEPTLPRRWEDLFSYFDRESEPTEAPKR